MGTPLATPSADNCVGLCKTVRPARVLLPAGPAASVTP